VELQKPGVDPEWVGDGARKIIGNNCGAKGMRAICAPSLRYNYLCFIC